MAHIHDTEVTQKAAIGGSGDNHCDDDNDDNQHLIMTMYRDKYS